MQAPHRLPRLLALGLALVLVVGALGACGDDDAGDGGEDDTTATAVDGDAPAELSSGDAAVVNGVAISEEELRAELDAIAGNELYRASLEDGGITVVDPETGEYDPEFAAQVLNREIFLTLVEAEASARGLEPDDSVREAAAQDVAAGLGGQEIVDAFPEEYQERLRRWAETSLALQISFVGLDSLSDEALVAWYEEDPSRLDEICVRHILVASEQEAQDALARLDDGESFEGLAAELSVDPGSAEQGGDLGCTGRGAFVGPFEEAAFSAPVGEVAGPVATTFGWHLIRVDERRPRTPTALGEEFGPTVLQASTSAFEDWAEDTLSRSTVVVAPAWGTWQDLGPAGPGVVPPGVDLGGDSGG